MMYMFAVVVGITFSGGRCRVRTGGHRRLRDLLGIFAVDVVHNPIHPVVGILGVAAYYWDRARLYCQGLTSSICSPVSWASSHRSS